MLYELLSPSGAHSLSATPSLPGKCQAEVMRVRMAGGGLGSLAERTASLGPRPGTYKGQGPRNVGWCSPQGAALVSTGAKGKQVAHSGDQWHFCPRLTRAPSACCHPNPFWRRPLSWSAAA